MFDHIFENRDKKVTNIIKLSDYLGRSLRENVEVFSIDDSEQKVTFITESGYIIAADYDFNNTVALRNIQIETDDLFEDNIQFDEFVDYKISNFIQNIFEEDFAEADTSFNKVLQLWESRVKFSSIKNKLYEKSQKFNGTNRIIESEEFQKVVQIAPQLVDFLTENDNLINIPEIKNMVRLSSAVSHAFDLPKLSYDDLKESSYVIPSNINHNIYEMICKQELIRKELVESKNNFNLVWLNNDKISNLASLVYEADEKLIVQALVEAVVEVPYFSLATKKQINETLTSNLELNSSVKVSLKEIKAFSSYLFEIKKPLKEVFLSMLNEKYGISVQNLKDIPTFKSLLNTQVLIFESLSKLSPKGTVQKDILSEVAKMLKTRNGVESIDVNRFIELLFEKAGYTDVLEGALVENLTIKETFSSIDSVEELVNIILEKKKKNSKRKKGKEEEGDEQPTPSDEIQPNNNQQADEVQLDDEPRVDEKEEEKEESDTAVEDPPQEEEEEKKEKTPTSDEIMKEFKSFEDILKSIDFESLMPDEEREEEHEEEVEKEQEVEKEEEGEA
tara:strand:+ start:4291 stop:5973 length:1683 start_codon:yes stop_codon:yes gene_type:complete